MCALKQQFFCLLQIQLSFKITSDSPLCAGIQRFPGLNSCRMNGGLSPGQPATAHFPCSQYAALPTQQVHTMNPILIPSSMVLPCLQCAGASCLTHAAHTCSAQTALKHSLEMFLSLVERKLHIMCKTWSCERYLMPSQMPFVMFLLWSKPLTDSTETAMLDATEGIKAWKAHRS